MGVCRFFRFFFDVPNIFTTLCICIFNLFYFLGPQRVLFLSYVVTLMCQCISYRLYRSHHIVSPMCCESKCSALAPDVAPFVTCWGSGKAVFSRSVFGWRLGRVIEQYNLFSLSLYIYIYIYIYTKHKSPNYNIYKNYKNYKMWIMELIHNTK